MDLIGEPSGQAYRNAAPEQTVRDAGFGLKTDTPRKAGTLPAIRNELVELTHILREVRHDATMIADEVFGPEPTSDGCDERDDSEPSCMASGIAVQLEFVRLEARRLEDQVRRMKALV